MSSTQRAPWVAVIGGATAGAEMADRLAEHGATVVVFEQNPRPYGKVEDGLPRWHVGLRNKEYETIRGKLARPGVHFVPCTRIGEDVGFSELVEEWGFSAVILANGAWRDRPLPVEGADAYVSKGLVYQNPFVIAFNHAEDPHYDGETFDYIDGTIVIGGGLASIDVAKILSLETTREKLSERGIEVGTVELEVAGIPKILAKHGLCWEDLELEGCTIYYRRRLEDMPLVSIPDDATPERTEKIYNSRRKLLEKATKKFCFHVEPLASPEELIVEGDRLVGLRFRRTRIEDGRAVGTDETFERRAPVVISSIGSIPEPIPGIGMRGELFAFTDWDYGLLEGFPTVFSAGNVVTGKGNIVESRKHATFVSERVTESYLGLSEGEAPEDRSAHAGVREGVGRVAAEITQRLADTPPPDAEQVEALIAKVKARQKAVGYPGDFKAWIESVGEPA